MSECLSVATTERWIWASPLIAIQQMQPLQVVSSRCLQCEEVYEETPVDLSKTELGSGWYLTDPGIPGVRSLVLLESGPHVFLSLTRSMFWHFIGVLTQYQPKLTHAWCIKIHLVSCEFLKIFLFEAKHSSPPPSKYASQCLLRNGPLSSNVSYSRSNPQECVGARGRSASSLTLLCVLLTLDLTRNVRIKARWKVFSLT